MGNINYIKLRKLSLINVKYMYCDTKAFHLEKILKEKGVNAKITHEFWKPDTPYLVALVQVRKKDEEVLLKAFKEIYAIAITSCYRDYDKFVEETMLMFEDA